MDLDSVSDEAFISLFKEPGYLLPLLFHDAQPTLDQYLRFERLAREYENVRKWVHCYGSNGAIQQGVERFRVMLTKFFVSFDQELLREMYNLAMAFDPCRSIFQDEALTEYLLEKRSIKYVRFFCKDQTRVVDWAAENFDARQQFFLDYDPPVTRHAYHDIAARIAYGPCSKKHLVKFMPYCPQTVQSFLRLMVHYKVIVDDDSLFRIWWQMAKEIDVQTMRQVLRETFHRTPDHLLAPVFRRFLGTASRRHRLEELVFMLSENLDTPERVRIVIRMLTEPHDGGYSGMCMPAMKALAQIEKVLKRRMREYFRLNKHDFNMARGLMLCRIFSPLPIELVRAVENTLVEKTVRTYQIW
jgi:hypothetical protein